MVALGLRCGAQASYFRASRCRAWALGAWAFVGVWHVESLQTRDLLGLAGRFCTTRKSLNQFLRYLYFVWKVLFHCTEINYQYFSLKR